MYGQQTHTVGWLDRRFYARPQGTVYYCVDESPIEKRLRPIHTHTYSCVCTHALTHVCVFVNRILHIFTRTNLACLGWPVRVCVCVCMCVHVCGLARERRLCVRRLSLTANARERPNSRTCSVLCAVDIFGTRPKSTRRASLVDGSENSERYSCTVPCCLLCCATVGVRIITTQIRKSPATGCKLHAKLKNRAHH